MNNKHHPQSVPPWQWSEESPEQVLDMLTTHKEGLSQKEASERLEIYGPNSLPEASKDSLITIFIRQFKSPLLYILIIAALIAMLLGEVSDGIIIAIVLLLNGVIGTFQEGKAQDALFGLKEFTESNVLVMRDGEHHMMPSQDVVPGDIVILREGDKIPADGRLISCQNFSVNEAALTGESLSIQKTIESLEHNKDRMIADQKNMVFNGTSVSGGTAHMVVIATGLDTEIGKISEQVESIDTEIPLQRNIINLSHIIILVVVIVIGGLFAGGVALGNEVTVMLMVSVALLVSVIPEGLPVVMTLILARGVKRMSDHKALVKRLQSVESLGQANIIAVDKTGTLTKNELAVAHIYANNQIYDVSGSGYDLEGGIMCEGDICTGDPVADKIARMAALSSEARIFREGDERNLSGDPTEVALIVLGEKHNLHRDELIKETPILVHMPFDYDKKYLRTDVDSGDTREQIFVGAPEAILEKSSHIWAPQGTHVLDDQARDEIHERMQEYSAQGLRIIGLAEHTTDKEDENAHEGSWVYVGFFAMQDSLRPEVPEAMRAAQEAGVRVVMLTGDHALTAQSIATQAGIYTEGDRVLTGAEILSLSEEELAEVLDDVTVFARVAPQHKMRIIQAYKARGDIIAMTGDGVNDVPSLVAADLGVAMGKVGTEVAKDAADMVLLDDNFGNIARAIEEGRHIYATLKKTLVYFFSTNVGELLVIVLAVLLLNAIPLLPAQIVWLNLVTDSFLVMTLAFVVREGWYLKKRDPQSISRYILDWPTTLRLFFFGIIIALGTLLVFALFVPQGIELARTMAFLTLALFQIFRLWTIQSETESVITLNPLANKLTLGASLLAIGLQVFAIYTPFMQRLFETVGLTPLQWGIAALVASSIILLEEIRKFFVRRNGE